VAARALPDGAVRQVSRRGRAKLSGFTLLFEALVLLLCQQMTFRPRRRGWWARVGTGWPHSASAVTSSWPWRRPTSPPCVSLPSTKPPARADMTNHAGRDAVERHVLAVAEGRSAETVEALASELASPRRCPPASHLGEYRHVAGVHQGCGEHLPNARITFGQVTSSGTPARVDKMRRIEQRSDRSSRACAGRCSRIGPAVGRGRGRPWRPDRPDDQVRTGRAWVYKDNCARSSNASRSTVGARHAPATGDLCHALKVEPMKEVADLVRVTWKASWPGRRRDRPTASWRPSWAVPGAKRRARGSRACRHPHGHLPGSPQARLPRDRTLMPLNPLEIQQSLY